MSAHATTSGGAPSPSGSDAGPTTPPASQTPAPTVNPAYAGVALKEKSMGPLVELLQTRLRDLGYFNYKVSGYFGNVTTNAVEDFQKKNDLSVDGVIGGNTMLMLFSNSAERILHNARKPTPSPKPTPKPTPKGQAPSYGTMVEWSKANKFVAWGGGPKFLCKDVRTGRTYFLIRVGGQTHMDVEPATAVDTAILKACYGGTWSWDRRPTLAQFGGKWYAASINGKAHAKNTVPNNDMDGQVCLHFLNSRTHTSNVIDAAHQRNIREAAGK